MSEPRTKAGQKIVDLGVRLRDTEETIALVLAIEAETLEKAAGRIAVLRDTHDPRERYVDRNETFRLVLAALSAEGGRDV